MKGGHYSTDISQENSLTYVVISLDVCMDKCVCVSLCEAVISESAFEDQGSSNANRCTCFKTKLKCNSRCHYSLNC